MNNKIVDYHVHSTNSADAEDSLFTMCHRAVALGIAEIAFTEHIDFDPTDPTYGGFDYARYVDEIAQAREEFAGKLIIHKGVECDYQEQYEDELEDFLSRHEFDYVLGAAHYADGLLLETKHTVYFPSRTERESYTAYFRTLRSAVASGMFDAIAHLDLCKRYGCLYYGPFHPTEYADILEGILENMIRNGTALEINTSGLRQIPEETYPGVELLKMYTDVGGKHVVTGSDAHSAAHLGSGLTESFKMISEAGLELVKLPRKRETLSEPVISMKPRRNEQ